MEKAESASLPSQPRNPKDIDIDEPIWEWAPPYKGTARKSLSKRKAESASSWLDLRDGFWWLNEAGCASLPPKRKVRTKFTYKQFLNLLWQNSELYIAVHTAMLEDLERQPEADEEKAGSASSAVKGLRLQLKPVRQFAKLFLGGGPEGAWLGKSPKPDQVHNDVVGFAASGQAGFDASVVAASSAAWDLYDQDIYSVEDYAEFKQRRDLPYLIQKKGYDLPKVARRTAAAQGMLVRVDPEAVREYMPSGDTRATGADLARKIVDPVGTSAVVDPATGELKHLRCNFVYTREVMDAMGTSMVHRNVKENSQCVNVAVPGTVRCELHGGLYASPEETRRLVIASQMKMFNLADQAVSTIADVMLHGATEASRLRAAETILNRSGITEGSDFEMPSLDGRKAKGEDASDKIRKRLQKLADVTDEDLERIRQESSERVERQREAHEQHQAPERVLEGEVEGEVIEDEG